MEEGRRWLLLQVMLIPMQFERHATADYEVAREHEGWMSPRRGA